MFRIAILSLSLLFFMTSCQQDPKQETQQTDPAPQAAITQAQGSPKEQMDKAKSFMAAMDTYVANEDFEGAKVEAEQAIYYLKNAVAIDPNYSAAVAPELSRAFYYNSNFQEAQIWYLQALDADPDNPEFHKMLGLSQFNLGNIPDAQNSVAKSMNFDESEGNRQAIVNEMMRMASTSFDFGTAYLEDGYPQKGSDYQKYGLALYRLAFDLDGHENKKMAKQIVTWATFLEDQEVVDLYQPYLK
jgi:tetratricopeptide (TPR) repeat protein